MNIFFIIYNSICVFYSTIYSAMILEIYLCQSTITGYACIS